MHTVCGTSGNSLPHGREVLVFEDAWYHGLGKRSDAKAGVTWHLAMRPERRRELSLGDAVDALIDKVEKIKAGIRAKMEYPFLVIKR